MLTEHDLAAALRQCVPERNPAGDLADKARSRAAHLRSRRRAAASAVAAVVVLLVGVPLAATAFRGGPNGSPAATASATHADACAHRACHPTVLAAITRPLRLPTLASGQQCPVSPVRRLPAGAGFNTPFSALGSGPLFLVGAAGSGTLTLTEPDPPPVVGSSPRRQEAKVIWVVGSSYGGPLLLRGARIDKPGALGFQRYLGAAGYHGGSGDGPHPRVLYVRGGLDASAPGSIESMPGGVYVHAGGCYAVQVDGVGFSERLVFQVASR